MVVVVVGEEDRGHFEPAFFEGGDDRGTVSGIDHRDAFGPLALENPYVVVREHSHGPDLKH